MRTIDGRTVLIGILYDAQKGLDDKASAKDVYENLQKRLNKNFKNKKFDNVRWNDEVKLEDASSGEIFIFKSREAADAFTEKYENPDLLLVVVG